eukprot:3476511-Prorocentrum_lima.AAC.1
MAIAIQRSRVDTEYDADVDPGAASSAAPAPAAKRWSRPTAAKSTTGAGPGEPVETAPSRGRSVPGRWQPTAEALDAATAAKRN